MISRDAMQVGMLMVRRTTKAHALLRDDRKAAIAVPENTRTVTCQSWLIAELIAGGRSDPVTYLVTSAYIFKFEYLSACAALHALSAP